MPISQPLGSPVWKLSEEAFKTPLKDQQGDMVATSVRGLISGFEFSALTNNNLNRRAEKSCCNGAAWISKRRNPGLAGIESRDKSLWL